MSKPELLIDADLYAFSTACAFQKKNPFKEGEFTFDGTVAKAVLDKRMANFMERFNTPKIRMFFSCNRSDNWRRQLVSSYKANREGKLSPIGLPALLSHLKTSYPYIEEATLEADDLLGIYATEHKNTILISYDKDMLTIPTTVYNSQKDVLKKVSRVDAFKMFIYQSIKGDSSDGYKGIKGVGHKGALKFIAEHSKKLYGIWEPLVELAEKKKHDEEYMIAQCRMAHILQHGDYNFETREVNLWTPDDIEEMLERR